MELPAHYPQWRIEYGKMESRASLSSSLTRLREACSEPGSGSWWGRVEASGWLSHVARLLSCAKFVALSVHRDGQSSHRHHPSIPPSSPSLSPSLSVAVSVVVHGAGGVDSTLQVTALAQVLLDPTTRTMAG